MLLKIDEKTKSERNKYVFVAIDDSRILNQENDIVKDRLNEQEEIIRCEASGTNEDMVKTGKIVTY